ncbi:MAG: hypothetical protein Satyrvirus6_37 [Satyrvirus sp.]|uniref:Nudix hydrolase domain-containing protein n=1 Tax=Satyrvirus sp. TaxID=2487771 RepID=A0A3G5ADA4_9VIRU|nr:MAG: hypothetical protein Satyrvirus6_37 [Satyrvirus sp.]
MEEVTDFKKSPGIKNAVVVLRLGQGYQRVLTVTRRSGQVGFPGGRIEKHDKSIFDAMKREFKEETGNLLPKLENIRRFVYDGHTAIYVAETRDKVSTTLSLHSDGEITQIHLTKLSDIHNVANGKGNFVMRDCERKSTQLLLPFL